MDIKEKGGISMVGFTKSLYFKLVISLFICMVILMGLYTVYQCQQVRVRVEKDLEVKGLGLAKAAAQGLQTMIENDIKQGVITKEKLFDRKYTLVKDDPNPKLKTYTALFNEYCDANWQKYVDGFLVEKDVVFAIPVAYSPDSSINGYLPTHNTVFKDRSDRIFNDPTGAGAANTLEPLKQVYQRDTGETMWDMSYPIYIEGEHWGGYRVAISIVQAEAKIWEVQKNTIIIMAGMLLLITAVLLLVTKFVIGNPLQRILIATENLSSGRADLTQRLDIQTSDELGVLACSINEFIEKIHQVVKTMSKSIEDITQTSDMLSGNSDEVAKASQNVAVAVEDMVGGISEKMNAVEETRKIMNQFASALSQITVGAAEQANSVNQTSVTISTMAGSIYDVSANAESVLGVAMEASTMAHKGEDAVNSTISGMEKIKSTVNESAVRIKELGEQSQKIGEIIQVIDDIAEQTNLLALNAAIEAARAGEHGKGFAVVADEVRKLAERSGKATKEIADLITNIQKGTEKAVGAMEQGTKEVQEGVRLAHDAGAALQEILKTFEQVLSQIKVITTAATELNDASSLVVGQVDNVAAIIEENSASTEEMAAGSDNALIAMDTIDSLTQKSAEHAENISSSAEEMAAATEDISQASETLNKMAHELRTMAKGFDV
jgi:methyl-accepting chemotaxis protein